MFHEQVQPVAPDVAAALGAEVDRQRETLAMIASENHVSEAVMAAQGSTLTNNYAEGTPGDRYYEGCEHADTVEELAQEYARELWGAEHVNVQPHSGTQANMAALYATLEPGDTVLSAGLKSGGHLSHGHRHSAVGRTFDVHHYGLDPETGRLDDDALRERAEAVDPDLVISGYSAYPRQVEWEAVQAVADAVDAVHLADVAHITGLVAAGIHPSPVGVADIVTGSTHKTIRAGRGGIVMCGDDLASDVDRAVMPGVQGGPAMHNVAGKAVGFREALEPEFEDYAEQVVDNARALAAGLREHGLDLVAGGTDTHLVLVDLRETHPDRTGAAVAESLAAAGIVANGNAVPDDHRPTYRASGLRLGTPALTTRGMGEAEMETVADCVARVVDAPGDEAIRESVRSTVADLCAAHPLYE